MLAPFVLLVREGLEAALLVSILVAYLNKIGRKSINKFVYFGAVSAVLVSLFVAVVFGAAYKSFGPLFEGLAGLFAVIILTYMILWMADNSRGLKGELEKKASEAIHSRRLLSLYFVAFVVVLREGVETVLFLGSMAASIPLNQMLTGSAAGLLQFSMAAVFIALLAMALFGINVGPFNNSGSLHWGVFEAREHGNNFFILALWIIWLPLVSLSALLLGRLWCGNLCPLRLVTEFASDLVRYLTGKTSGSTPYLRAGWVLPTMFIKPLRKCHKFVTIACNFYL